MKEKERKKEQKKRNNKRTEEKKMMIYNETMNDERNAELDEDEQMNDEDKEQMNEDEAMNDNEQMNEDEAMNDNENKQMNDEDNETTYEDLMNFDMTLESIKQLIQTKKKMNNINNKTRLRRKTNLYKCFKCSFTHHRNSHILYHIARVHFRELILENYFDADGQRCGICKFSARYKRDVIQHVATKHKVLEGLIPEEFSFKVVKT
jgi:hypothetical protein